MSGFLKLSALLKPQFMLKRSLKSQDNLNVLIKKLGEIKLFGWLIEFENNELLSTLRRRCDEFICLI